MRWPWQKNFAMTRVGPCEDAHEPRAVDNIQGFDVVETIGPTSTSRFDNCNYNTYMSGTMMSMMNCGTFTMPMDGPIYPLYDPPTYCDYCDSDISNVLSGKCPNCGASKTRPKI